MIRVVTAFVAVVLCVPAVRAADAALPEGNWRVSEKFSPLADQRLCLVKVEKKDGKLAATVIDTMEIRQKGKDPRNLDVTLDSFSAEGNTVAFKISVNKQPPISFEGTIDPKDSKIVRGVFIQERRLTRAEFVAQSGNKIEPATASKAPEPYTQAVKLNQAHVPYLIKAQNSKDVNEKAELQAKAKEVRKESEPKVLALYKKVVDDHGDTNHAVYAASQLIGSARKNKAGAQEVAVWIKVLEADAAKYGKRFARVTSLDIAEDLVGHPGFEAVTLAEAVKAGEGATEKDPLLIQSRYLKVMVPTLKALGNIDEAKANEVRLAKVETALDDEYKRTVPPFQPTKYPGRKDKEANRVVVMELFTGAQCPPCVAADVAFDALEKAYDHKDLVLIQYHMHIPGPDPLTNLDSIARWDFYRDKFPAGVRGTPTTLFNGKTFDQYDKNPMHAGGGGMTNAANKFDHYKAIIDPLLEEKTTIKIAGAAKLVGDKVNIDLSVDGIQSQSEKIKLRVLLLEESIKYVGGNGLRFHHQVVRKTADADTLNQKAAKKSIAIDLAEVKRGLTKYLDEYAVETPFPYPERPMDLKNLKAVVLVQDEDSGEILNAVQLEVK